MRCCDQFSPATCAGLDAICATIGIVLMAVGFMYIPPGSEHETATGVLLIVEMVLMTIQLFQSFVHYCAGKRKDEPALACFWLMITLPSLLTHVIVLIVVITVLDGQGLTWFAVAFGILFIQKLPQVFNMLDFCLSGDRGYYEEV